jgi:hypothetical protein
LVVCTPWTHADVYRFILEKYDYRLYRRSVLEEDADGNEVSLLPHKWTVEELHKERARDPYYFSSQMMCQPKPGKEQAFDPSWLRNFAMADRQGEPHMAIHPQNYSPECREADDEEGTQEEPPRITPLWWCNKAILVDPASADATTKTSGRARTGAIVVAMDPWGRRFLLDAWAGQANPDDVIKKIFMLAERWETERLAIEETTFSNIYRHWIKQEMQRRGTHLTITPLKPKGRRKQDRIEGKIPGFARGLYYVNEAPALNSFRREYLDYPYGQTRDLMDALAYDSEVLRRPESPGERQRSREATPMVPPGIDPLTGY